jgi:hypothetical protein
MRKRAPAAPRPAARPGVPADAAAGKTLSPEEYVKKVEAKELRDPTLSFQLRHGFKPIAVVSGYLQHDDESLGFAAVIEWLNQQAKRT